MLRWWWKGMGKSSAGMSAGLGALDEVFNPGAARSRALIKQQNERVQPAPSPGDKVYDEKRIVIDLPARAEGD